MFDGSLGSCLVERLDVGPSVDAQIGFYSKGERLKSEVSRVTNGYSGDGQID